MMSYFWKLLCWVVSEQELSITIRRSAAEWPDSVNIQLCLWVPSSFSHRTFFLLSWTATGQVRHTYSTVQFDTTTSPMSLCWRGPGSWMFFIVFIVFGTTNSSVQVLCLSYRPEKRFFMFSERIVILLVFHNSHTSLTGLLLKHHGSCSC